MENDVLKSIPEVVPTVEKPTPEIVPASSTAPVPQAVPQAPKAIPEAIVRENTAATAPVPVSPYAPSAQTTPVVQTTPVAQATPVVQTTSATQANAALESQEASATHEADTNPVAAPAINPATINPMPEKAVQPETPAAQAKVSADKSPVEEENEKKAKTAKKEKKEKKLGVAQTILISAAVGLLFSIIGTVAITFAQKKTNFIDKLFAAEEVVDTDIDVVDAETENIEPEEDTDNQVIDTSSNAPLNSFNTAYTTIITGESDVITVAENAMPSMVSIIKEYEFIDSSLSQYFGNYTQGQTFVAEASGSGFIIAETDTEYLIVSNNHVVENPISLEITFADGSAVAGYIKGCDKNRDLAVVAVLKDDISDETVEQIRIASLGDSNNLRLGEQVVAIGNALGYGQSVTTGIISALNREVETEEGVTNKFIQTDAAINPGNSGGALLNMAGQVIGINSAKLAETSVEGMGYAIPISDVTDIIEELMEHSTKIPLPDDEVGYIGISLQEVTQSLANRFGMPVGIYIVETVDGGAAEAAGLMAGDVITEFAGEKIESYDELDKVLQCHAAGETVTVKYQRSENGSYVEHTTQLTLGSKP